MAMAFYVVLLAATLAADHSLNAATLYSVEGPLDGQGEIASYQALGVSWTQSTIYTNLTISAELSGLPTDSLTVYLTTHIGPGTTVANTIAETTVPFPVSTSGFTNVELFDLPALQAGTYYLTFYSAGSSGGLAGAEFSQPAQIIDPSFTLNPQYVLEGQLSGCCASPLPADPLVVTPVRPPANPFAFSLTGNVVAVSATPEPLPGALVGAALGGLLVLGALFRRPWIHPEL